MKGLKLHCCINLGLNVLFAALVTASLFSDFFQFKVSFTQEFKVGLTTLTHQLPYQDLVITAFTYFSSYRAVACVRDGDEDYEVVCSHIAHFQAAGVLFIICSAVLLILLLTNIASLFMIALMRSNWLTQQCIPHFTAVGFFILYASAYLLISCVDTLQPTRQQIENVRADTGIPLLFVSAAVGLVTLFHYLILRRVYLAIEFSSFLEPRKEGEAEGNPPHTHSPLDDILKEKLEIQRILGLKTSENEDLMRTLGEMQAKTRKTEGLAGDHSLALKENKDLREKLRQKDLELERSTMDRDNYAARVHELETEVDDLRQQLSVAQNQLKKFKRQGAGRDNEEVVVMSSSVSQGDDVRQELQDKIQLVLSLQLELKQMEGYRQKAEDLTVLVSELEAKERTRQIEISQLRLKVDRQREKISLLSQQIRETEQQTKANLTVNTSDEYIRVLTGAHSKQIRDLKQLYDQNIENLNVDLETLRASLTDSKNTSAKSQKEVERLSEELSRLKERKAEDDLELKRNREDLRRLEDLLRAAKVQQATSDGEVSRLSGELNIKIEQCKRSEEDRLRSIDDLSSHQGLEQERIRHLYEESVKRDTDNLRSFYEERLESFKADQQLKNSQIQDLERELSDLKHEYQAAVRGRDSNAQDLDRLKKELEEVTHKLVHEQTVQLTLGLQVREAKALAENLQNELSLAQQKYTTLEDFYSKAMMDLEYRLKLNRDSLQESLTSAHLAEMRDVKALYQERLDTMQHELTTQRQAADKNQRERERLEVDVTYLVEQVGSLKEMNEKLKAEFKDAKQAYDLNRTKLEARIAELEDEILRLKSEVDHRDSEASFRDDTGFYEAEIERLKKLLAEREAMMNSTDNSEYQILILDRDRQISELIGKLSSQESSANEWKQEAERMRLDLTLQVSLLNEEKQRLHTEKNRQEEELQAKSQALALKKSKATTVKSQLIILQEQRDKEGEVMRADHNRELERVRQLYTENFNRDLENMKELYESRVLKLQTEVNSLRVEVNESAERLGRAVSEKAHLERRLNDLQRELDDLRAEFERIREENRALSQKTLVSDEERERLYKLQEILKRQLLDKDVQLEESSNSTQVRAASQDKMLGLLSDQLADLRNSLGSKERSLENVMKERDELRLELSAKQSELGTMSVENSSMHKELSDVRRSSPSRMSLSFASVSSPQFAVEDVVSDYSAQSIEETVILEGLVEIDIRRNPLIEKVAKLRNEPPMTYTNMWRLLETLMAEKVKVDKLELALGRQCRPMVDFAADFMYLQAGLQSLSLKQLKALIRSLEDLHKANHPYATFFCRLLGLFHPRPFSQHLSIFLLLAQEQFGSCEMVVKEQGFAKNYDITQYGGQAKLLDVMELIMRIFKNQRETGERIITHLTNRTDVEATLVKVCGTMARMGRDADFIFEVLDNDKSGELDYHEFVDGIRYNLNIWVTEEEVEQLCEYIDSNATGKVTQDEWGNMVDFQNLAEKAESNTYTTTKSQLLSSIVEEYEQDMLKDYYKLRGLLPNSLLTQDQFFDIVESIDHSLDERAIQRLYDQAIEKDKGHRGKVSAEAFCTVVLKNKVGEFGHGAFELDGMSLDTPRDSTRLTLSYSSPSRR
jgi:chromosome segregation ATPase